MPLITLSLGSSIDADKNIRSAMASLAEEFGSLTSSSVYESEAVGFVGDNFLNLVVALQSEKSVGQVSRILKNLENSQGRDRSSPRFSGRTLDIDILTYDDAIGMIDGVELPRAEIVSNAFVLLPLAELLPDELHPQLRQSYQALWAAYDKNKQRLWRSDLSF